jgi:hypothetical protein
MIGIVYLDLVAFDKIGWIDYQICAAGMTQRWKQDATKPRRDDQVGELPGWRCLPVDAGNLMPSTIPFPPRVRIEPL